MDIKSLVEQIIFRKEGIPTLEEYLECSEPEGKHTHYDMSTVKIGSKTGWKPGYTKDYVEGVDPPFMSGLPWDKEDSTPDNLIQTEEGLTFKRPKGANQKNALISSNFKVKYGTFRAIAKLPSTKGAWSAFWLFRAMPELDVFEHCGGRNKSFNCTHHWGFDYDGPYGKKSTLHNERYNKNLRLTEEYYAFEVVVSPYKVEYFINGIPIKTMRKGIPTQDTIIIFNVSTGSYCGSGNHILENDAYAYLRQIDVWDMS